MPDGWNAKQIRSRGRSGFAGRRPSQSLAETGQDNKMGRIEEIAVHEIETLLDPALPANERELRIRRTSRSTGLEIASAASRPGACATCGEMHRGSRPGVPIAEDTSRSRDHRNSDASSADNGRRQACREIGLSGPDLTRLRWAWSWTAPCRLGQID